MKNKTKTLIHTLLLTAFLAPVSTQAQTTETIASQLDSFYQSAIAIGGVLAVIMIIVGGIYFSVSGGSADKKKEGKKYITSALWGLVLLLGAYLILNTINPELTTLEPPKPPQAEVVEGASCNANPNLDTCEEDENPYGPDGELKCCVYTGSPQGESCGLEKVKNCRDKGGVVGEEDAGSLNTGKVFWCENSGDPLVEPNGCSDEITWMSNVSEGALAQNNIYLPIEIEEGGAVAWSMFYPENTSTSSAQCGIYAWRTSSSSDWNQSARDGLTSCE